MMSFLSIVVFLPIAFVCLRAAVAVANRFLGPSTDARPLPDVEFGATRAEAPDPDNPYSAPSSMSVAVERTTNAIPAPGFGRSLMLVFVQWLVNIFAMFTVVGFMEMAVYGSRGGSGPILLLVYPVAITLANAIILKLILPTTFRRGLLVSVLQVVLSALMGIAVIVGLRFFLS